MPLFFVCLNIGFSTVIAKKISDYIVFLTNWISIPHVVVIGIGRLYQ